MKLTAKTTGIAEARAEMLRIGAMPSKALAVVAEDVEEFVSREAAKHNKRGALVQSVYLRRAGDAYDVGHDGQRAPHAPFVHWGTKPHEIKPKKKGVLRWAGGGLFHFAKRVQHPGYRGDPWMTRAATLAPRLFDQQLQALLAQQRGA